MSDLKKFSIVLADATVVEMEEYIDTIADVFTVGNIIEGRLSDGFQLEDLFALIQAEPTIREVVKDAPVFWEQFKVLVENWETAKVVDGLLLAKDRVVANSGPLGKISGFVFAVLTNAALSYQFAGDTLEAAKRQVELWKTLFSGTAESAVLK